MVWNGYHTEPTSSYLTPHETKQFFYYLFEILLAPLTSVGADCLSEVIILSQPKEQKQLTGERCSSRGSALLTQQEWGWKAPGTITEATQPPGQDKKRKTVGSNSTFPWGIKKPALDSFQEGWQKLGEDCRTPALKLQRKGKAQYVFKPRNNILPQGIMLVNCTVMLLGMYICYFKYNMKKRLKIIKSCYIF